MSAELDQKAMELAIAVQKLQQLTTELETYSRDIQDLSRQISEGNDGRKAGVGATGSGSG